MISVCQEEASASVAMPSNSSFVSFDDMGGSDSEAFKVQALSAREASL